MRTWYYLCWYFAITFLSLALDGAEITDGEKSSAVHIPVELSPSLTIEVPMRDGTLLPTDIYLPEDRSQKYPCLLLRNPGGRQAQPWRSYSSLSAAGYIIAIQDTRSALDVEGKTLPFFSDGWGNHQDGYDTIEWLAKWPPTNGKVGTLGFSACGITQLLLAPSAPPSLCCQYIGVASSNLYHQAIYLGGLLLKSQVEGWLASYAKHPSVGQLVLQQPLYNDFWQNFDSLSVADKVKAPALHYGGWYDTFLQGTIDAFASRQYRGGEGARGTQKLIIGPWTHMWPRDKRLGDFTVPANGEITPWDMSPLSWFDYHLKGKVTAAKDAPAVTYFTMGPLDGGSTKHGNTWHTSEIWPVPAELVNWYLSEKGLTTTSMPSSGSRGYSYNLDNPVPTIGGRNLFLASGPKDQRPLEERTDVLVFTSPPLTAEVEVTGRLNATIYFTATRYPCDIAIRFCDVYPDGRSILIADGMARSSPSADGEIAMAEIDLWSTSTVFAQGHSLRLLVSSSNYPRFEQAQLAEGASKETQVTVLYSEKTPSRITLPVVKK